LAPVDLEAKRAEAEVATGRKIGDTDLASYLMYPKVFKDYALHRSHYGDVSLLPTPAFFYGLAASEEISIDLERGKSLIVSQQGLAGPDSEGMVKVFLELNGQSRLLRVPKAGLANVRANRRPRRATRNTSARRCPAPSSPSPPMPARKWRRATRWFPSKR
jgi:pyruvate carboxylase